MRNVIVTGGSRGLGLSIVKALVEEGYGVAAIARNNSEELQAVLTQASTSSLFISYDLANAEGLDGLVKSIGKTMGPIYGLVNNAARGLSGMFATESQVQIEDVIHTNLVAPILLTRVVLRSMMAKGEGRIVNVSSVNAFTGYSGLAVYAATKAGLIGFTRSLAREVGRAGITVNAVAPGLLETDMTGEMDAEKRNKILRRSPLKRFAKVQEVASAISYLLSDAGAGMTGTVMTIDAGNSS